MFKSTEDVEVLSLLQSMEKQFVEEYSPMRRSSEIFDRREKENTKKGLLTNIRNSLQEIMQYEIRQIEVRVQSLEQKVDSSFEKMQQQIDKFREAITSILIQPETLPFTPRKGSGKPPGFTEQSDSTKKSNDLDERNKQKLIHVSNLVNLLMENQVQIKLQVTDLSSKIKALDVSNNASPIINNDEQIQRIITQIELRVSTKLSELSTNFETIEITKLDNFQNKLLFYWKVLEDQSEKIVAMQEQIRRLQLDNESKSRTIASYFKR